MSRQPHEPNPQCLITMLHRSWVAWLPELDSPIRLEDSHILALGGSADEVDEAVLCELREQGLLLEESVPTPPLRTEPAHLSDSGDVSSSARFRHDLRLNRHLALRPHPGGFLAYSDRRQCYVVLPTAVVLALARVDAEEPESPQTETYSDSLAQALESFAFLVREDDSNKPNVRTNTAVAFARHAVGGASKALRERVPDEDLAGRVPVYFAGCIDLAMDMSYGYLNLALGLLMASARTYDGGRLTDRYYLVPHFLLTPTAVLAAAKTYGPGVAFFSNYIWAHKGNLQAAQRLKALDRRFVTVFGGPQAPSYPEAAEAMLESHPHVDVLVRGEGEETASHLLDRLRWSPEREPEGAGLEAVPGLTYRAFGRSEIVRTLDRPRIRDLADLPSPYLDGTFDHVPQEILYGATLETNRGCPYGCAFCDWGSATRQKIRKFEPERVRAELDWIGHAGISVLFCADANFGIFERDIEIAQMIAETASRHGALKQVVTNYAKNATRNLAEIVRIFARAGLASEGIISIQTRDPNTLKVVNRDNIKTHRYDELLDVFRSERLPMSTDLMIGLPGATPDSFKDDLQHYFETGVQAKAYLTRILVNSPMAHPEYRERYEIQTDAKGFIRSCSSYTESELNYMLDLFGLHSLAVGYGLLKYVLSYLQWDEGIRAVDFVDALLRAMKAGPTHYPRLSWTLGFLDNQRHSPGGWRPVLEEIAAFAESHYGVAWGPVQETVIRVQEAVLSDPDKAGERALELDHDFVSYYRDGSNRRRLDQYGPGTLEVSDPQRLCRMDPARHYQYDTHSVAWELASELNDVDRPVFFLEQSDMVASTAWPKRTPMGQRAW